MEMGNSPAAAKVVEELTRLHQDLPRRPSAEEVEAAQKALASAEAVDAVRLAEVEGTPLQEGVPVELLAVLQEARLNAVPPIPLLRLRKEAALVMEVERRYQVFDDLLRRASLALVPSCETPMEEDDGIINALPPPLAPWGTGGLTPGRHTGGLHDEMVLCEILMRLPAMSVLRCRAVCKSWHRLTSDPTFLLSHHRRQTALPLMYFCHGNNDCIGTIDLHAAKLRPVFYYTWPSTGYCVKASCDGLLLLSAPGRFYICNPVTNQWAALPQHLDVDFLGLYSHHPSKEYRLLYCELKENEESVCNILTVGSRQTRRITMIMGSEPVEHPLGREFLMQARGERSTLVRGNLHWYLRARQDDIKIMVFNTATESFQLMRHPVLPGFVVLFEMDGTLGMSLNVGMERIDLWELQDYERNAWSFKYSIMVQIGQFLEFGIEQTGWLPIVVSAAGDVLVRCSNRIFHCDRNGNLVGNFQFDGRLQVNSLHRLKESLVLHDFFQMEDNNGFGLPPNSF